MATTPEATLKQNLHFETLLSEISTSFIKLKLWQIDKGIQKTLEQLGIFMRVDRVYVMLFSEDGSTISEKYTWVTAGTTDTNAGFQEIPATDFPWFLGQIAKGDPVSIEDMIDLPSVGQQEIGPLLQANQVQAAIAVPIIFEEEVLGFIAFDDCQSARDWPLALVNRLRLVGEILANALSRRKNEEALNKAYQEIALLKDQLQAENTYLRAELQAEKNTGNIVGSKRGLKQVMYQIQQVAPTDSTVLILGETGTGKELLAQAVHEQSARKNAPLIKLNCAALPSTLIESELFGHEKGAFTGALTKRIGRFELAHKGTLFLDEIGEMPIELQVKLLRVLQEGELERIGNPETIKVDVRIIAATNRDLKTEIAEGRFRSDLYYRLCVFPIQVPPLRNRKADLPELVEYFAEKSAKKIGKAKPSIPSAVIQKLQTYPWPGNIRELENAIERAMILHRGTTLQLAEDVFEHIGVDPAEKASEEQSLAAVERQHIQATLQACHWKIEGADGAAMVLGLHPSTLRSRIKKLGIRK